VCHNKPNNPTTHKAPSPLQAPMFLSALDVRREGLRFWPGSQSARCSNETKTKRFRALYGSSPFDVASLWYDLTTTENPRARLTAEEKTESGFIMYLAAHYFLWTYPKNASLLASHFSICERNARGEPLWQWIRKIAAMKDEKIVWDERLDSPLSERFIITVDGTDFRVWEQQHPTLPIDRSMYSIKFNHGAYKYEIALSIFFPKCVWIYGPHRGGKHDLTIFREQLKGKIAQGKLVIADRGYQTSKADEQMLSTPDITDDPELYNFKSRARLRQETFNGRLKFFHCLSDTFRHGIDKHKVAFEAVVVLVQYQMDNGSEIFAV
jgi:DDE superfamily endonuclease